MELAYRETTDDSNEDGVGPDAAEDEAIADASEELQRRSDVIGRGYPFTFDGIVLTASDTWANEAIAYVFLLLLSAPGLPGKTEGRRLFEEVVTAALAQYLAGESLRFGFPYRHPVPSHPNEALNYLAKQMGQPRLSTRQVRASEKDMGVDAVAWKPFSDSRSSKVVLLANCSTGTDWNSKLGELNIEKWKRMIDFGCNPVQAFAVPWIPNYEDWADIVDYGNMVVDRARVASLLFHWNASPTIQRWCAKRLQEAKTL
ncbi:MAG: hypothetical protein OXO53_08575 [Chloroflexota bacterium]|nr:hypothetical protein [Chloroflexota bacterium]